MAREEQKKTFYNKINFIRLYFSRKSGPTKTDADTDTDTETAAYRITEADVLGLFGYCRFLREQYLRKALVYQ